MRRLTAAAGIATALLALAACRSNPDVAAYVGDRQFTEAQVTQLLDDLKKQQGAGADPSSLPNRTQVVQLLVLDQLCQRVNKAAAPAPAGPEDLGTISQRVQTCNESLQAAPVQPTEADLREVYDNGVAVGAIVPADPEQSFEKLKDRLGAGGEVATALGKRKVLTDAAKAADVSVNPRYRSLQFPLLSFQQGPAISAILGQPASEAVVDRIAEPSPEALPQ
ncbi:hypothetical protein QEZ54_05380 [Catellatospora sp. KI3]|uniref:hypothetical protein n=1 Tax=Catellatospora sp. KI3 TaxID=3041620 RepID=UPI0024821FA8|nr:hypothetical protein [Catellatospora sp. KI3]MDI1460393.1 hypothetical protein [Catellatospora sp. KI3]